MNNNNKDWVQFLIRGESVCVYVLIRCSLHCLHAFSGPHVYHKCPLWLKLNVFPVAGAALSAGLINMENTCYLNSTLQVCLISTGLALSCWSLNYDRKKTRQVMLHCYTEYVFME